MGSGNDEREKPPMPTTPTLLQHARGLTGRIDAALRQPGLYWMSLDRRHGDHDPQAGRSHR
jgi:hypothetical protein